MTTDWKALCAGLLDALDSGIPAGRIRMSPLAESARAALAQPQPEPPTDAELTVDTIMQIADEFFDFYGNSHRDCFFATSIVAKKNPTQSLYDFAWAVLARWGRPAPAPPAEGEVTELVSDRLPQPEDCDAEGRCWWGRPESDDWSADWTLATPEAIAEFCEFLPRVTWLPFNALPLPSNTESGDSNE